MIFFIASLVFHVVLLYVFMFHLYYLYFVLLFVFVLILHRLVALSDYKKFLFAMMVTFFIINQNIYDEILFGIHLKYDLLTKLPYIDSEVMYILSVIHILLLLNLKRIRTVFDHVY